MDKKQIKDYIILISKIYIILFCIIVPFNILVSIMGMVFSGNNIELLIANIIKSILGFLSLGLIVYTILGIIYLFTIIRRKSDMIKENDYTRELPKYFPPAIVSLILDLNIENTTDYTATIAYLISKKYIRLSEDGGSVKVISDSPSFNSDHEDYVFKCITKKRNFNQYEFKRLVIEDAKKMNLIIEGKRKIHFFRNFFLAIGISFLISILYNIIQVYILKAIIGILYLISAISVFAVIGYSFYLLSKYNNEGVHRTIKGTIEARKWTGIKNYLRDYTLISDRNLKDIVIFEDYIPYAIALNEAKTIEKFIQNNEQYRKLIYGNKF